MTPHWKSTVEPYASDWKAILAFAERGLIHGMQAHEILCRPGRNWTPSDTASFLRDMVEACVLRPVTKDIAGAGVSRRAFAGLTGGTGEKHGTKMTPEQWLRSFPREPAEFWTFEIVRGGDVERAPGDQITDYRGEQYTIVSIEANHVRRAPDYRCLRVDGTPMWVPAASVRGEDMAYHAAAAAAVDARTLVQLHEIREGLVRQWEDRWPGADFGKALVGMSLDGAIADTCARLKTSPPPPPARTRRIVAGPDPTAPWVLHGDDLATERRERIERERRSFFSRHSRVDLTYEIEPGIAFATREMAERAASLPVAEAYTLCHAERRICDDYLEPHELTVSWKLVNDLPLTMREQQWLDARKLSPKETSTKTASEAKEEANILNFFAIESSTEPPKKPRSRKVRARARPKNTK